LLITLAANNITDAALDEINATVMIRKCDYVPSSLPTDKPI
jgi:hypothetical protein